MAPIYILKIKDKKTCKPLLYRGVNGNSEPYLSVMPLKASRRFRQRQLNFLLYGPDRP